MSPPGQIVERDVDEVRPLLAWTWGIEDEEMIIMTAITIGWIE
jgi:hypothetical protein